jgi:hypothetical protein
MARAFLRVCTVLASVSFSASQNTIPASAKVGPTADGTARGARTLVRVRLRAMAIQEFCGMEGDLVN